MTLRARFADWLEKKLNIGIDYCQDRSIYRIRKTEDEDQECRMLSRG